jgi:hypothetical protein
MPGRPSLCWCNASTLLRPATTGRGGRAADPMPPLPGGGAHPPVCSLPDGDVPTSLVAALGAAPSGGARLPYALAATSHDEWLLPSENKI